MSRPTTYTYQNHLLTGIDDALGQAIERTTYDAYTPAGRVIAQTLQDGTQLSVSYLDASTVITTTGVDGRQDVKEIRYFDPRNTLTGIVLNGTVVQDASFDPRFSPSRMVDGNGNATSIVANAQGQPLEMTDALGQKMTIVYDSQGRRETVTDSLGRRSTYSYDSANNLIRQTTGITTAFPLGFTTLYTYTNTFLTAQQDPTGVVAQWTRDASGQVLTVTLGFGTALAQTTAYGYDTLGRVVTTTIGVGTSSQRQDVTQYNADNTIAATIQHYVDGVFDPAHPAEDIVTTYGYDLLGRQLWVATSWATTRRLTTTRRDKSIGWHRT